MFCVQTSNLSLQCEHVDTLGSIVNHFQHIIQQCYHRNWFLSNDRFYTTATFFQQLFYKRETCLQEQFKVVLKLTIDLTLVFHYFSTTVLVNKETEALLKSV